jgi:hypothetical protein
MNKQQELYRLAEAAKTWAEPIWINDPSAVLQVELYADHQIHEVLLAFDGSRVLARLSSEDDPDDAERSHVYAAVVDEQEQ